MKGKNLNQAFYSLLWWLHSYTDSGRMLHVLAILSKAVNAFSRNGVKKLWLIYLMAVSGCMWQLQCYRYVARFVKVYVAIIHELYMKIAQCLQVKIATYTQ